MTTYSLVRGGALREQGMGRSQTPKLYQGKPTGEVKKMPLLKIILK